MAGLFAQIKDLKSLYGYKKVILMKEIKRLALCFLALGHVTDAENQFQKLAMKNQIFAVFYIE